jgi:hypothetical protein
VRDRSGETQTDDGSSPQDWQTAGWLLQRSGEAHALHWLLRRHGAGCATLAAAAAAALVGAASDTSRLAHALLASGACSGGSRIAVMRRSLLEFLHLLPSLRHLLGQQHQPPGLGVTCSNLCTTFHRL